MLRIIISNEWNKIIEFLKNFLRDPLWQGVGSIATFLVTIFTYLSLRQYKKREEKIEKREIFEKIIQPVRKDLENIIEKIPRGYKNYWNWQKIKSDNYYLILRMNQNIREKIEKFNENWGKFENLFNQYWDELNELFHKEIINYFNKRKWTYEYYKENARYWSYLWDIGGKTFSVNFFELIFQRKTLKEYIEISKNNAQVLNREFKDRRCKIGSYELEINEFEEITNHIKQKIQESEKYIEYFNFKYKNT
jgi:hypothetical protein